MESLVGGIAVGRGSQQYKNDLIKIKIGGSAGLYYTRGSRLAIDQLYMRSADGRTLFETRRSGRTSGGSQFAHGPDGFTAYIFNGRRYRVVADKQGSVRRLVVEIGTVVALF